MSRTVDLVEDLIREGMEVPQVPVEWRPRHFNQMADHMVNEAMTTKRSGKIRGNGRMGKCRGWTVLRCCYLSMGDQARVKGGGGRVVLGGLRRK